MGAACSSCRGVQVAPAPVRQEVTASELRDEVPSAAPEAGKLLESGECPRPAQRAVTLEKSDRPATTETTIEATAARPNTDERTYSRQVSSKSALTTGGSFGAKSTGHISSPADGADLTTLGSQRAVSMKKVGFAQEKSSPFKSRFKVGKSLGKGAFSSVRIVTERETKDKYAVKIVKIGQDSPARVEDVHRELDILRSVDHRQIMRLIDSFEEEEKIYIVSELLPGGELLNSLLEKGGSYTEEDAQICFRQLLKALSYIHGMGIIHRDLKLENLLLRHPKQVSSVKLIDFGMAKYASTPEVKKSVVGTPLYVAPEILAGDQLNPYWYPADMWSAGVVLHILLVGFPPFFDEAEPTLFAMIKECKYSFDDPAWSRVSEEAKDLVSKLLKLDPAERLSANAALEHKFCRSKASEVRLVDAVDNMRGMMNRKLKGAVKSVMAISRMSLASTSTKSVALAADLASSSQMGNPEIDTDKVAEDADEAV